MFVGHQPVHAELAVCECRACTHLRTTSVAMQIRLADDMEEVARKLSTLTPVRHPLSRPSPHERCPITHLPTVRAFRALR